MLDSRPPSAPKTDPGAIGLHAPPGRAVDKIPRKFGRYRIQDCLGRGGMGAVFRAHDTQLDRIVALKVPFLGADDNTGMRERFYREARAAAALHHANICPVFDVGELHGVPYLTMAFIEGRSLARALEAGQPFTPQQVALLVRKLALGMQEAHARGVIHRDLKPANIILRPDGEPVIMDFGLARRGDDPHQEGMTRQGDVIGTVEYMSPEQFEGDNAAVGPASDVYALGVVLYELLTGRRPFDGSTASKMAAILLKPPPRPSELRPGLPARLEEICLKAMSKLPADRHASMTALAADLTAFLRSHKSGVIPAAAPSVEAPPTPRPSATTKPIKESAIQRKSSVKEDQGWEVVEETPPAEQPKPRSAIRPRIVSKRKKTQTKKFGPILLGGSALAVACLSLIIAAIIMRPGSPPSNTRPTPPPASQNQTVEPERAKTPPQEMQEKQPPSKHGRGSHGKQKR